jgi:hypothetical protein
VSDFEDLDLTGLDDPGIQSNKEPEKKTTVKKAPKRKRLGEPPRKQRIPLHKRNTIKSEARPGFVRRIVNDIPGRVQAFLDAGYTVVTDGTEVGDHATGLSSGTGTTSTRQVGGGVQGVLMEIPVELYNEDQAEKQAQVDQTEHAILPEEQDMQGKMYGSVSIDRGQGSGQQSVNITVDR